MISLTLFGIVCAAAVAVAHMARLATEERDCVVFAAWVLLGNWMAFSMPWIYAPASPAFVAYSLGLRAGNVDMWALFDLISLLLVAIKCRNAWWSPLLWIPYLITLTMHSIAWCNGLEYIDYRAVLDASLVMQLAVIFTLGGGGCADILLNYWHSRVVPSISKLGPHLAGRD